MPRLLVFIVLLLTLLNGPSSASTQAEPYAMPRRWAEQADTVFHHLSTADTLGTSAIAQDAQGFLWFGSSSGLTRWDGYRYRSYPADPLSATALPDNYVLALHTDPKGRLWVGTSGGGLARYDPRADAFVNYAHGASGDVRPTTLAIEDDADGGLWVGTSAGLQHLNVVSGEIRSEPYGEEAESGSPVRALLKDRDGTLWISTLKGLLRRSAGSSVFESVALPEREKSVMHHGPAARPPIVTRLRQDSAGRIWIATHPRGAFVLEPGQVVPRAVIESGPASTLQTDSVLAIVEALPGQVWLSTYDGGVVVVDTRNGWRTRRIRHQVEIASSLRDSGAFSMFRDASGLIWVGSVSGVSFNDPRHPSISTLFSAASRDRAISASNVALVAATANGRVWVTAEGGGIDLLDPALGRVAELRADPLHPEQSLPSGAVIALAAAPSGELFIGTRQGLYRADSNGRSVVRLNLPDHRSEAAVTALCMDGDSLWLGSENTLFQLDVSRPGVARVLRRESAQKFGNQQITELLRGVGNTLWVGTRVGLTRVAVDSELVERVPTQASDPGALAPGFVTSMLLDRMNRLWIGSAGGGLQVIEGSVAGKLRVRRFSKNDGLPHNNIQQVLLDSKGNVWAGTDNGLAQINPSTYEIRKFGPAQGVEIRSYLAGAALLDGEELLFGGIGGLTVVRPAEVEAGNDWRPPVVVTEARASGKPIASSAFNLTRFSSPLVVASEEKSFMVEFATLDMTAPDQNRYSYRLNGFDADWTTTEPTRRLVAYTNLPPGNYTLQLRGGGHEAAWAPAVLEVPVQVLPSFYQTVWFRLGVVLSGCALIVLIVQRRTVHLRQRQQELQQLVALRTADLNQRGDELRQSQLQLEKLAYFDPLTGLANRRRFNEDLQLLISLAKRGTGSATLLLIDLDRFKEINDTLGHDAGDALLVEVARRLLREVRESDRVARLGGDEFAVILSEGGSHAEVDAVCQRIVENLAQPLPFNQRAMQASASVGVACCPAQGCSPEVLYKCADLALYEAKRAGRNTWRWHELHTPAVTLYPFQYRSEAGTSGS